MFNTSMAKCVKLCVLKMLKKEGNLQGYRVVEPLFLSTFVPFVRGA